METEQLEQIPALIMGISVSNMLTALIILVLGIIAVKCVSRAISASMHRAGHIDASLQKFLLYVVRAILYFVLIIICAGQLGLPVNSLIALLGTLGLAVSLALQDALKNIAGGIFLLFSKPFATGDIINVDGVLGTVHEIGITHTVLLTDDNRKVFIPNGKTSALTVTNYSADELRRVEIIFTVPYKTDIALAKKIIGETVLADSRVKAGQESFIRVWELSAASVSIMVRVWCDTADSIELRCALLENVKLALDSAEI